MSATVKTLLTKLLFWLAVEIVLNLVGLDNFADYSEFIAIQTTGNMNSSLFNSSTALLVTRSA